MAQPRGAVQLTLRGSSQRQHQPPRQRASRAPTADDSVLDMPSLNSDEMLAPRRAATATRLGAGVRQSSRSLPAGATHNRSLSDPASGRVDNDEDAGDPTLRHGSGGVVISKPGVSGYASRKRPAPLTVLSRTRPAPMGKEIQLEYSMSESKVDVESSYSERVSVSLGVVSLSHSSFSAPYSPPSDMRSVVENEHSTGSGYGSEDHNEPYLADHSPGSGSVRVCDGGDADQHAVVDVDALHVDMPDSKHERTTNGDYSPVTTLPLSRNVSVHASECDTRVQPVIKLEVLTKGSMRAILWTSYVLLVFAAVFSFFERGLREDQLQFDLAESQAGKEASARHLDSFDGQHRHGSGFHLMTDSTTCSNSSCEISATMRPLQLYAKLELELVAGSQPAPLPVVVSLTVLRLGSPVFARQKNASLQFELSDGVWVAPVWEPYGSDGFGPNWEDTVLEECYEAGRFDSEFAFVTSLRLVDTNMQTLSTFDPTVRLTYNQFSYRVVQLTIHSVFVVVTLAVLAWWSRQLCCVWPFRARWGGQGVRGSASVSGGDVALVEHKWLLALLVCVLFLQDPVWVFLVFLSSFSLRVASVVLYSLADTGIKLFWLLLLDSLRVSGQDADDVTTIARKATTGDNTHIQIRPKVDWRFYFFKSWLGVAMWSTLFGSQLFALSRGLRFYELLSDSDLFTDGFFTLTVLGYACTQLVWLVAVVYLLARARAYLQRLPYLATRYRQLAFRFFVFQSVLMMLYFVLFPLVRWWEREAYLDERFFLNISTLLMLSVYSYLLCYVYLPVVGDEIVARDRHQRQVLRKLVINSGLGGHRVKMAHGGNSQGGNGHGHLGEVGVSPSGVSARGMVFGVDLDASRGRSLSHLGGKQMQQVSVPRMLSLSRNVQRLLTYFDPKPLNTSFSLHTARWVCDFASMAYCAPPGTAQQLAPWGTIDAAQFGFELVHCPATPVYNARPTSVNRAQPHTRNTAPNSLFYFIARKYNTVIVSFRGTNSKQDILTDLDTSRVDVPADYYPASLSMLTADGGLSGALCAFCLNRSKVHRGFWRAYQSVREEIQGVVSDMLIAHRAAQSERSRHHHGGDASERYGSTDEADLSFIVTGHSMGAAVAVLCALELRVQFGQRVSVYTYGGPRVGNAVFRDVYNALVPDTFRVVCDRDIVPSVPQFLFAFRHVGVEVIVDICGNYLVNPSFVERSLWKQSVASIKDHSLDSYQLALEQSCVQSGLPARHRHQPQPQQAAEERVSVLLPSTNGRIEVDRGRDGPPDELGHAAHRGRSRTRAAPSGRAHHERSRRVSAPADQVTALLTTAALISGSNLPQDSSAERKRKAEEVVRVRMPSQSAQPEAPEQRSETLSTQRQHRPPVLLTTDDLPGIHVPKGRVVRAADHPMCEVEMGVSPATPPIASTPASTHSQEATARKAPGSATGPGLVRSASTPFPSRDDDEDDDSSDAEAQLLRRVLSVTPSPPVTPAKPEYVSTQRGSSHSRRDRPKALDPSLAHVFELASALDDVSLPGNSVVGRDTSTPGTDAQADSLASASTPSASPYAVAARRSQSSDIPETRGTSKASVVATPPSLGAAQLDANISTVQSDAGRVRRNLGQELLTGVDAVTNIADDNVAHTRPSPVAAVERGRITELPRRRSETSVTSTSLARLPTVAAGPRVRASSADADTPGAPAHSTPAPPKKPNIASLTGLLKSLPKLSGKAVRHGLDDDHQLVPPDASGTHSASGSRGVRVRSFSAIQPRRARPSSSAAGDAATDQWRVLRNSRNSVSVTEEEHVEDAEEEEEEEDDDEVVDAAYMPHATSSGTPRTPPASSAASAASSVPRFRRRHEKRTSAWMWTRSNVYGRESAAAWLREAQRREDRERRAQTPYRPRPRSRSHVHRLAGPAPQSEPRFRRASSVAVHRSLDRVPSLDELTQ